MNNARMRFRVHTVTVVLMALSFAVSGCEEKKKTTVSPAETEPAEAAKPKIPEGQPCTKNEECAELLGCGPDKTCQTFKTIECLGRETACKKEGRCRGSDKGCIAGSNDDCKRAEACKEYGRCTAKDGKCTVGSDADCANLCKNLSKR